MILSSQVIRLHFQKRALDLIAVYQNVYNRQPGNLAMRAQLWKALDDCLEKTPNRNLLVCSGDFNCSVHGPPAAIGTASFPWRNGRTKGPEHPDMEKLQIILGRHMLVAANSWPGTTGPTYVHGIIASRIDFIFIRAAHSDGRSKQIALLSDADFLPLNTTHHIPMICLIRRHHMSYHKHDLPRRCSYAQRACCRRACAQDSDEWRSLTQHVEATVETAMEAAVSSTAVTSPHDHDPIQMLHDNVAPLFHSLFPACHKHTKEQHDDDTRAQIETKWYHKKQIRALANRLMPLMPRLFEVWKHFCCSVRCQRVQQRLIRQARHHRFLELCADAERAASFNDSQTMFRVIQTYCPKRRAAKARLRTTDGQLANQHQAHAILVEHVSQKWRGPETLPRYSNTAPGVPFTVQDLTQAIGNLHPNKSVAFPFLPAIIWKSNPVGLATFLHGLLTTWWNQSPPHIPKSWKNAWLYFLPKPGKPSTSPSQLRPLSLMEPLGKLVMGLLADQLKSQLRPRLQKDPHFGFLPQRGATDAIARVAAHCRQVRALVGQHRRTVMQQIMQTPKLIFCGGLQLFLDLSCAFDTVNRLLLFNHLADIQVQESLLTLISAWHMQTEYVLTTQELSNSIQVGLGLRQGCKVAPTLRAAFMGLFLTRLSPKTGLTWIRNHITLYADDIHVGCCFQNVSEFQKTLENFGHILDTLEELHLQLSYSKSFVLFQHAGTNSRHAQKGAVQRTDAGMQILIPRCNGPKTALPIRATGKYLGVVMSYHQFEDQTWTHRKRAAWSAFSRLKPWFHKQGLSPSNRLHIWKTCVLTIMTYGLIATNVTARSLQDLQTVVFQMIRTVLGDHSYCTHNTHQAVFHQHGLPLPLRMLRGVVDSANDRLVRRTQTLDPDDILRHVNWCHLQELAKLIDCVADRTPEVTITLNPMDPEPEQALQCPYCSFITHTVANMRRHCTTAHNQPQYRTASTNALDMSHQGRPQCNHCFQVFTTWRSFFIHVQRDCCQASTSSRSRRTQPDSDAMPLDTRMTPPAASHALDSRDFHAMQQRWWPQLRHILQTCEWLAIRQHASICTYLTHTCCICGLWCNRFQELHGHFRLHHAQFVRGMAAKCAQLAHLLQYESPCPLCQNSFRQCHSCNVLAQVGFLYTHTEQTAEGGDLSLRCVICNTDHVDLKQLYRHLRQTHELTIHDWSPARDALEQSDACRHCGDIFETRSGLQRHIIDGRCPEFDPESSPQTLPAANKWQELLHSGDFSRKHFTAQQRLHLTLRLRSSLQ